MYRIAVIDDDQSDSEKITEYVKSWAAQRGSDSTEAAQTGGTVFHVQIHNYSSAEAFLFAYEEDKIWDLLFLDVEMCEMSGVVLAKKLRQSGMRAEIVFVTSHFEFWGEGYEVDALHYLTKPLTQEVLNRVLDKAYGKSKKEPASVVVSCEGETVKLLLDEILYVEAFSHYISIHTAEREYRIKESISGFGEKLGHAFFRIHRSYLVSLKQITRISRKSVTVNGGKELPLARGNYDAVSRAYIEL